MWGWTVLFIALLIPYALEKAGIVASMWTPLAGAGIITIFVLIHKYVPAVAKRWVNIVLAVFLIAKLGPMALDVLLNTGSEIEQRAQRENIRVRELIHPSDLAQISAFKTSVDAVEGEMGNQMRADLKKAVDEFSRGGDFSAYQKSENIIKNKMQKNISWRNGNKKFITDTSGFSLAGIIGDKLPDVDNINLSGENILWAVAIFYLVLLAIAAFSGKGKAWGVFFFAIVAGLVIWAVSYFSNYYYRGGYSADVAAHQQLVASVQEVQKRREELNPPPERRGHYNKPEPKVQGLAQKISVNLDPVHWSKKIPWSRDYNIRFDMPGKYEVMLSTGDRIINRNDGTTSSGLITYIESWGSQVSYPHTMEFRRAGEIKWFIVRGAPGAGTVTITEQFSR